MKCFRIKISLLKNLLSDILGHPEKVTSFTQGLYLTNFKSLFRIIIFTYV